MHTRGHGNVRHGGADWGSLGPLNGFNPLFNFSISIGTNSVAGMNCSAAYRVKYPVYLGCVDPWPALDVILAY